MKFFILITIIFTLIAAVRAATSRGLYKDPNHPGKCVINDMILSPGEHAQKPNHCTRIICGKDSWVQFHTCGIEIPPEGYKLGEPIMPQADYPDCCKHAFIPKL